MKTQILENIADFKPFNLTITVESEAEALSLLAIVNQSQIYIKRKVQEDNLNLNIEKIVDVCTPIYNQIESYLTKRSVKILRG